MGLILVFFSLPPSLRPSVLQVVLADPLSRQLRQDVVQVIGVGVTVARQIGAKLGLVVNLVPHHRVRLPRGAGRADGEDQAPVPRCDQQLQDLVDDREEDVLVYFNRRRLEKLKGSGGAGGGVTFRPLSLSGR